MSGTAPGRRQRFLELAIMQVNSPYIWGGKGELRQDPENPNGRYIRCFDCSGLVTYCLYQTTHYSVDWRPTHNAEKLRQVLPPTDEPVPGDLAFYGPASGPAKHVVILLGGGLILGANGGNSDTKSIATARKQEAHVKADARGPSYRRDLIGFRSMSPYLTT